MNKNARILKKDRTGITDFSFFSGFTMAALSTTEPAE